jgi:hypothetical protein
LWSQLCKRPAQCKKKHKTLSKKNNLKVKWARGMIQVVGLEFKVQYGREKKKMKQKNPTINIMLSSERLNIYP